MTYLSRHCYNKAWRCPGWAGGGWTMPKVSRCAGGSLDFRPTPDGRWPRWYAWHWHRCRRCDVIAIPLVTRWLDPTWLAWCIRRMPDRFRDWLELREHRRERRRTGGGRRG